jgi:hypothetical protein
MSTRLSGSAARQPSRARRRSSTLQRLRVFAVLAGAGLALGVAEAVASETLSGEERRLHGGEVVSSSMLFLQNEAQTRRLERSAVGGLAPGRSAAASGLHLEGSIVTLPEPALGLQGVVAMLALLPGWCRRSF